MKEITKHWYHGGNLEEGKPKTYLYVINTPGRAKLEADKRPNGKVYRLLPKYNSLVVDHPDGRQGGIKVISQKNLQEQGGALSVFKEYAE